MPVDWHNPEVQNRLLAAVIASVDNKISPAKIAALYGSEEMTYNAAENYLRKFRKDAKAMMAGSTSGSDNTAPATTPKSTPRKNAAGVGGGVKTGRVTKPKRSPAAKKKDNVPLLETEDTVKDVVGSEESFKNEGCKDESEEEMLI